MPSHRHALAAAAALLVTLSAGAQPRVGDEAPDFPLGLFSDGNDYRLTDLRGRAVVLFFYESQCPRCRESIPERNAVMKAFEDRPVKFLAVGASDPLGAAVGYGRETGLRMPAFADSLGLMEARYGQKISLQNIYQFRVIGPDGKVVGYDMDKGTIERAMATAAWKYDPKDYDPKLKPALDAFEWNQWAAGMKLLTPLRKGTNKAVAESANKLFDVLRAEAEGWKAEAQSAAAGDPVKAYDLHSKLAAHFPGDPVSKGAPEAKLKLAAHKAVAAELAARKAYAAFAAGLGNAAPNQKALVAQQANAFLKKHAGTPTGDRVAALVQELGP
jgi:peroxiredoxin